jgi:hypothetical protein
LLDNLDHFTPPNRKLAIQALLRTDVRCNALLDAIANGRLKQADLDAEQKKTLLESKNPAIRTRAASLFTE